MNPSFSEINNDGWEIVTNGLKLDYITKKENKSITTAASNTVLNKYALPQHLEKKLHQNSESSLMFQHGNNNINNK